MTLLSRLQHARAAVQDIDVQLDILQQRRNTASTACDDLLAEFSRDFFVTVPEELLILIFDHVATIYDTWECAHMMYQHERALMPFRLAAVCWRWRTAAIATSGLWTYLGVDMATHDTDAEVARIELLKDRSGVAGVDVIFGRAGTAQETHNYEFNDAKLMPLASALLAVTWRWRRVEWYSPSDECEKAVLQAFDEPTPLLEVLSLVQNGNDGPPIADGHLNSAPRLSTLRIEVHDDQSWWTPRRSGDFHSLTMLTIWSDLPTSCILDLLGTVGSTLRELNLGMALQVTAAGLPEVVTLPSIERLALFDLAWASILRVGRLRVLGISSLSTKALPNPAALQSLSSATEVWLFTAQIDLDVAAFRQFPNVEVLAVATPHAIKAWDWAGYHTVPSGFFTSIVNLEPPVLPRLRHIRLARRGDPNSDPDVASFEDLMQFVRSRNSGRTLVEHSERPCRLDSVIIEDGGLPERMRQDLDLFLSPNY